MWVSCPQTALLKAVQLVGRAISTRTTMPILGYILLETKKDGMKLTATDLELAMQVEVAAEVKQGGQLTLPARILGEIVVNLPPATVESKAQEGSPQAEISCEASNFEILGLPAGDFPTLPRADAEAIGEIDADVMRMMVNQTIFAVSADETRPFLTGVYVALDGAEAKFVATDGGRLELRKAQVPLAAKGKKLTLTSNTPEVGKAREEVEVTAEGEPIEAAFNARYLMDCLNNIEADELFFELTGPLSPGAIRPAHHSDYVYVLAPVRVYA